MAVSRRAIPGILLGMLAGLRGASGRRPGRRSTPVPAGTPAATPDATPTLPTTPFGTPPANEIGATVRLSSIPAGGGMILPTVPYVVTQPEAGHYMAFSTRCPHDNCPVGDIRGDEIICFCHGSRFALDGSLRRGPAKRRLFLRKAMRDEDTLYVLKHDDD